MKPDSTDLLAKLNADFGGKKIKCTARMPDSAGKLHRVPAPQDPVLANVRRTLHENHLHGVRVLTSSFKTSNQGLSTADVVLEVEERPGRLFGKNLYVAAIRPNTSSGSR
jgi:hypothetical protein